MGGLGLARGRQSDIPYVIPNPYDTEYPRHPPFKRVSGDRNQFNYDKQLDYYSLRPQSPGVSGDRNQFNYDKQLDYYSLRPQSPERSPDAAVDRDQTDYCEQKNRGYRRPPESPPKPVFFTYSPNDFVDENRYDILSEDTPLAIVAFSELDLGEMIGAGGYGKVYNVRHPVFPGSLAYKRINADFIQQNEMVKLKDEARIHMQLDHPNIVKCFAIVSEPENYGMVLEFLIHGEAKNYLRQNSYLRSKLKIIRDVAAGMMYLHSIKPHPVIHGDLKSENVLIGESGTAKVCDFGFSRWKEYSTSHSTQAVPLGTVTHVPPERWRDCNLRKNEKFDVYSFGITMWEILTLESPFTGGRPAQIQIWVENGQRPDLRDIPAEVPKTVVDLMVECWNGEKLKRPPFKDIILPRLEMKLETL